MSSQEGEANLNSRNVSDKKEAAFFGLYRKYRRTVVTSLNEPHNTIVIPA